MKKATELRARPNWWRASPFLLTLPALSGCLPDSAVRLVLGENIVLTSAIVIQTITASVFNSFFSLFSVV